MSEYVSKKALLEWLKKRLDETQFVREAHALAEVVAKIECGRFDDDQTEVQRLRAALKQLIEDYKRRIRSAITMIDDPEVRVEQKTRIHVKKATYQTFINEIEGIMNDEALSTTTEPTNKYFGAEWPKAKGDGNE